MTSELDYFYSIMQIYSSIENDLSDETKESFMNQAVRKLMKVSSEIDNAIFFQNAIIVISCLYYEREVDNYTLEGKDLCDLDVNDQKEVSSILLKESI